MEDIQKDKFEEILGIMRELEANDAPTIEMMFGYKLTEVSEQKVEEE